MSVIPASTVLGALVLCKWCTLSEAEEIRMLIEHKEIPTTVEGMVAQLEKALHDVRSRW